MPDPASHRDGAKPTAPSRESIGKLRATYDAADNLARKVAEFRSEVAIPAHNELRYAGYHLLRALADDGGIEDVAQIGRAVAHCERAQYEAAEAGIAYALDFIEQFKKDYKEIRIGDVVQNYQEIIKTARDAQNLLTRTRSTKPSDDRGELSDPREYMEMFYRLKDIRETLEDAREELNKIIRDRVRESRKFMIWLVFAIVGAIGVFMSIL